MNKIYEDITIVTVLYNSKKSVQDFFSNLENFSIIVVDNGRNEKVLDKIKDYKKTLTTCHSTVGSAILNTSITIVFGFSILVFSKFIPTIYFGVFTGLAMLLAMISVLTLLPSLILLIKPFGK